MLKLPTGEYLGSTLRSRNVSGCTLTLRSYPSDKVYSWHVHEQPTLFILLSGQHRDETRQVVFRQPPLTVVFHPTTGPHVTSIGPRGLFGVNLELTDGWLEQCQLQRRELPIEYRLLDAPEVRWLGLRLAALAYSDSHVAEADTASAAMELIAALVAVPTRTRRTPAWLPRALEFLRSHLDTAVSLADVAAEVGVHPVYCARAFRQATGCTVSTYVRMLRLTEAGCLILDDGRPLVEVADRVGFADQPHFTRACSKSLHLPPGSLQRLRQEWLSTGSNRSRRI